jgi:hypothetical protein
MTVADSGREELDVCPRAFQGMMISITTKATAMFQPR